MKIEIPRIIISGLKGGSGKTIISIALTRYFSSSGLRIRAFKKGPDYIDAGWLTKASGHPVSNLDPFFMNKKDILYLFSKNTFNFDMGLIEGNRGLFDGKDIEGTCSTAQLAETLKTPVVLVIDCTKMTRTVVPIIIGCKLFSPNLEIKGVIFNNTGTDRHRKILKRCVEEYTDVKVIGSLPRFYLPLLPERHMGLISHKEVNSEKIIEKITKIVTEWIDIKTVEEIAHQAPLIDFSFNNDFWFDKYHERRDIAIGIVKDASLWFYYSENLEALEKMGAKLVDVSLLSNRKWPQIHGLYLGGGFPETMAERLCENKKIKSHILELANRGLPIYAECGGLMYLCRSLIYKEKRYPMVNLFPIDIKLCQKPQGHGYTKVHVKKENPFFDVGDIFTGHEFHYSKCVSDITGLNFIFHMERGVGIKNQKDGILVNNTLGCYNHLHVFANPKWAENFIKATVKFKALKDLTSAD